MIFHGLVANADLSDKQFYAVMFVGGAGEDFRIALCSDDTKFIGILQDKPKAGEPATVFGPGETSKAKLEGVVVAGAKLTVHEASGKLTAHSGTNTVAGICPVNAVDEEITNVFLGSF